jgi:hypothetical protein
MLLSFKAFKDSVAAYFKNYLPRNKEAASFGKNYLVN